MKHKINITPLNCGFGRGLASIIKMEESEYLAETDRSIYCKDPKLSWFKMKSKVGLPYLEPAFYGLKSGDIINVEFDACLVSGSNPEILVDYLQVKNDYTLPQYERQIISSTFLKTHFKHFKISSFVPEIEKGILLNLRTRGDCEIIIKNIVVEIETENSTFSMVNNITEYLTNTDYKKCIDYVSGMNVTSTYRSLLELFNDGTLTVQNNSLIATNADNAKFKGLVTLFNGHKYRPRFCAYVEYISPDRNVVVSAKAVDENGLITHNSEMGLDQTATVKKKMVFFDGTTEQARKTIVDIGFVGGLNLTFNKVIFSMPQFDDYIKRQPNQIDELYTNLNLKLR